MFSTPVCLVFNRITGHIYYVSTFKFLFRSSWKVFHLKQGDPFFIQCSLLVTSMSDNLNSVFRTSFINYAYSFRGANETANYKKQPTAMRVRQVHPATRSIFTHDLINTSIKLKLKCVTFWRGVQLKSGM